MSPRDVAAAVRRHFALAPDALEQLALTGADPALPSSFRVGTVAQAESASCCDA